MEIQIGHYEGYISGYVKKTFTFYKNGFLLKKGENEKKPNAVFYSLKNAKVINGEKECEFCIENEVDKIYFKANSLQEKKFILEKLDEKIKEVYQNNIFSKEFHVYLSEIMKKSNENKFDSVTNNLTMIMNYFLEFQGKINDLKRFTLNLKLNNKINQKLQNYLDNIQELQAQMRVAYDDLVQSVYDYRDDVDPAYAEEKIKYLNDLKQAGFLKDDDKNAKPSRKIKDLNDISLTYTPEPTYNFTRRTDFNKKLKVSPNLIQELVKAAASKQKALPIYFNEPISMIQKECEKFCYSEFLDKAVQEETDEKKFLYLTAFIIGDLSFSGGRTLKPFIPLLGETYEYCDNERKFKFFGEQVFRKNYISAFYCEGEGWSVAGDTRNEYNLKIWKGCAEITFGSKVHIKIYNKNTKKFETFIYNRPITKMKGIAIKKLHYDFGGSSVLYNVDQPNIKCEINFIEESKTVQIGGFEGKITKDDEVLYLIGGNWTKEVYYTDKNGENKVTLFEIPNEKYFSNSEQDYVLPTFSYALNQITDELKKVLPSSDARFRPDQLEYEVGDEEQSQKIKDQIEDLQISRENKLEQSGKEYKPAYFESVYDEDSKDFYYRYIGDYWGEREKGKFENNKFNCFNLDPEKEIDEAP